MGHASTRSIISRRGFTLVELIVAMGIIVILAGLLVPMLLRAYGAADRTRINSQLAIIAIGIESYRQDFGDIPRWDPLPDAGPLMPGANLLGLKLVGPLDANSAGNAVTTGTSFPSGSITVAGSPAVVYTHAGLTPATAGGPGTDWFVVPTIGGGDGAEGPGFKVASKANINTTAGPVFGPYIDPSRFTVRGTVILDAARNPILYYPARNSGANVRMSVPHVGYVDSVARSNGGPFLFNGRDNIEYFTNEAASVGTFINNFRSIVGDTNANGFIDGEETQRARGPFLLMSAGPDRTLGEISGVAWPATTSTKQRSDYARRLDDCFFGLDE